ncbi:metal-dependent hydrolase [Aliibacillus thermotolerans]|uniref:Metal-dependent hydrolase n=1 Tax=Aliibacillus thermotolerans TaxID=1834418 RepID=A0ABW0U7L1_9BACI|nr:metal-dependent hydrolase [Aliibacillus thermotolerans]
MRTHVLGAITAGTFVAMNGNMPDTNVTNDIVFGGSLVVGALLPDLCSPRSWIGRRLKFTSILIQQIFGHRTFTHSLLFLLLLYYAFDVFTNSIFFVMIQYGLLIGVASHILLDMATPRGVMLFYPVKKYVRFPLTVKTGSLFGENIISILFLSWIIYFHVSIM